MWQRFLDALVPLHEAGRLGSLLFQLPPWFGIREDDEQYLLERKERARPTGCAWSCPLAQWLDAVPAPEEWPPPQP